MAKKIDLKALKERVDLLALAERNSQLRRVAATGGGEWAGPCPFCGGTDRFRVQPRGPEGGRWLCRNCTEGKWQDVLDYGKRLWPGLGFREMCARLAGGGVGEVAGPAIMRIANKGRTGTGTNMAAGPDPGGGTGTHPDGKAPQVGGPHPGGAQVHPAFATLAREEPRPAYTAPREEWQAQARQAIETCAGNLWAEGGRAAVAYLRGRGLQDETLRTWRLGYSPGAQMGDLWVARGVVIPCVVKGEVWYLKIALLPGDPVKCERCGERAPARQPCPKCKAVNKYRGVKGNRTAAIFGAEELVGAWAGLIVEGEFDALVAWQALRDVVGVCTLGSAANRLDLATWGAYLLPVEQLLATYDADRAGQAGLEALRGLSERVRPCPLPAGVKDINDFVLGGGDLWEWVKREIVQEKDSPLRR